MIISKVKNAATFRRCFNTRVSCRGGLSMLAVLSAPFLSIMLSGCNAIPKDGPYSRDIRMGAQVTLRQAPGQLGYALVSLSPASLAAANRSTSESVALFSGDFAGRRGKSNMPIAVGDVVELTLFEASSGGLFVPADASARAGNYINLPRQQVDSSGRIAVPYAGTVSVAGLTPIAAGTLIQSRIGRAIEPQVIVSIVEHRGNDVSIMGDVGQPTSFSLEPGGTNVLNAIARAGGPKDPPFETLVTIQRKGRIDQAVLSSIVKLPSQNIQLRAGDAVYVSHEPKIFMAFGATPAPGAVGGINNRRFTFDAENLTLAEGVARAGGLDATRADPKAVFLFRYEQPKTLTELGIDTSRYKQALIPTIYAADMSRPDTFFLSNSFNMRNKDILFVSEAPVTDLNKFTAALGGLTNVASQTSYGVYYFGH